MSERNPFDDESTPSGSPLRSLPKAQPKSFNRAQAEANKALNETAVKIHEAPPQVLPELITGEDYDRLEPESLEKVQQDLIDDARFATITDVYCRDTGEPGVVDLPTHQERLRAEKARCRQLPHSETYEDLDARAESSAEGFTRLADKRKFKGRVSMAIWSWSIFCFIFSAISSGNPLVGLGVGAFMFYGIIAVMRVMSSVARMGESSGNAV